MTSLMEESYAIPAAELGPENPLPAFRVSPPDIQIDTKGAEVPPEDRTGLGWQTAFRVLPYRVQDGYNRTRRSRAFRSWVLENDCLRVCVLPEVGGKVVSLFDKLRDRELLFRNPVFQPGNLALRNAWTAGGIEWNTPHFGHHYLACSPLHAARVAGIQGQPVLRLYAWERVKVFPYQIDLHLPEGSRFLFAHVRLINPHSHEIPMYWWTNIGVPEYPEGRVLCPADNAYHGHVPQSCPLIHGIDHSYVTRVSGAYDIFFRIPKTQRPWIAMVDRHGCGLIHTSTNRLIGRKMFAWGMCRGSRRWNEFLSAPGLAFQEIQAGLGRTQAHCVAMPARTEWSWTEAFGYLESDPRDSHAPDWSLACRGVDRLLNEMLPRESMEQIHAQAVQVAACVPETVLFRGLGWGGLERLKSAATGSTCAVPDSMPFSAEEPGVSQEPWLSLIRQGCFPRVNPQEPPGEFMIEPAWQELLEQSLRTAEGKDNWLAWYHLGVIKLEAGDQAGAQEAWERSNQLTANSWSLRNLAVLCLRQGNHEAALRFLKEAWAIGPRIVPLAMEYGQALIHAGRWDVLDGIVPAMPPAVRDHERVRLLRARLALHTGQLAEVEELLSGEFSTIRECEVTLSDLWFELQARKLARQENMELTDELLARVKREYDPPIAIDFRMREFGSEPYAGPQTKAKK